MRYLVAAVIIMISTGCAGAPTATVPAQSADQKVSQPVDISPEHTSKPAEQSETHTDAEAGGDVVVTKHTEQSSAITEQITSLQSSVQRMRQAQMASTQTLRNDVESLEELTQNVRSTVKNYGLGPERLAFYKDKLEKAYGIAAVAVLVVVGGAFFLLYLPSPEGRAGAFVTLGMAVMFLGAGIYAGIRFFILGG